MFFRYDKFRSKLPKIPYSGTKNKKAPVAQT